MFRNSFRNNYFCCKRAWHAKGHRFDSGNLHKRFCQFRTFFSLWSFSFTFFILHHLINIMLVILRIFGTEFFVITIRVVKRRKKLMIGNLCILKPLIQKRLQPKGKLRLRKRKAEIILNGCLIQLARASRRRSGRSPVRLRNLHFTGQRQIFE